MGSPFYTRPAPDPADRFFYWFNFERPNTALYMSRRETPMQAFYRMLPKEVDDVLDDLNGPGTCE